MFQAVTFTVDSNGIAVSYSLTPYHKNFVREVKNKGYKPHLAGFRSVALAEATANSLCGTVLETSLPPVQKALREGAISQSSPKPDADNTDTDTDSNSDDVVGDDGLQTGNGGDQPATSQD